MNLHAIVSPYITPVNPWIVGSVKVSTGYTTDAAYHRYPTFATFDGVNMQVHALTAKEIEHIDSLNIQGIMRVVYMNGNIEGLDRFAGKGGDLLIFNGQTWLVTTVLETWDASGWCKVAVTLQSPPPDQ